MQRRVQQSLHERGGQFVVAKTQGGRGARLDQHSVTCHPWTGLWRLSSRSYNTSEPAAASSNRRVAVTLRSRPLDILIASGPPRSSTRLDDPSDR